MSQNRILELPQQQVTNANPKIHALLESVQQKLGFIPNMYANMANAPHLLETYEPLAKVVSGNLLPHSGLFSASIFDAWNHHAPQYSLKIHSKWDCILSTQTFASGSYLFGYDQFRNESDMTPAEQEVVVLTISRHNQCQYCVAAHSMLADNVSKVPPEVTLAIRDDTEIHDDKLRALNLFTHTLLEKHGWLDQADLDAFLQSGYQQFNV